MEPRAPLLRLLGSGREGGEGRGVTGSSTGTRHQRPRALPSGQRAAWSEEVSPPYATPGATPGLLGPQKVTGQSWELRGVDLAVPPSSVKMQGQQTPFPSVCQSQS